MADKIKFSAASLAGCKRRVKGMSDEIRQACATVNQVTVSGSWRFPERAQVIPCLDAAKSNAKNLAGRMEEFSNMCGKTAAWFTEVENQFKSVEETGSAAALQGLFGGWFTHAFTAIAVISAFYQEMDLQQAWGGATSNPYYQQAVQTISEDPVEALIAEKLEPFKKYVLDENNWTNNPGGAEGGIDYDLVYGEQCVDIPQLWYKKLYGKSVGMSAFNKNGQPEVRFAAKNTMTDVSGQTYAAGDIGFTVRRSPRIGHAFVIVSGPDANGKIQILDQNSHSPMIRTIPATDVTNAYRYREPT